MHNLRAQPVLTAAEIPAQIITHEPRGTTIKNPGQTTTFQETRSQAETLQKLREAPEASFPAVTKLCRAQRASSSTHPPALVWFLCRFRHAAQADSRASSCTHLCRKLLLLFQQTSRIFSEITSPRLLYRRRLPRDDL